MFVGWSRNGSRWTASENAQWRNLGLSQRTITELDKVGLGPSEILAISNENPNLRSLVQEFYRFDGIGKRRTTEVVDALRQLRRRR